MTTHTITKATIFGIVFALILAFTPFNTASAQVFYQNYTPQTQQELIAYLYGLIASMQGNQGGVAVNPGGSVLGVSTGNSEYRVEVSTFEPNNIDGDEAWVWGEIDLNGAPYATVWFEYGENRNLGQRSPSGRIDTRTSDTFRGVLDDLDRGEEYFYRAVAQDPAGIRTFGRTLSFEADDNGTRTSNRNNNDDEPDVTTDSARDIRETSAELRGEVDMNDFNNGQVFFVYGEDEDEVEDVEDEDEFDDIDERGDDLQKVIVDRDLDGDDDFERRVGGLDRDTEFFFRICVEYEDDDDDETIDCGQVREFETDDDDRDSNDDEPDATTQSATNIEDDEAEIRGEVDMNDFRNGLVFFVYGEDENEVEKVEDEDEFDDIDEEGDDLQKFVVDRDLDFDTSYDGQIFGLDEDTDHFFRICVEYEDGDDDPTLECGEVREFETD